MSYILDALRRADAERGRAGVPGLHTQPVLPVSGDDGRRKQVQPVVWMGLGAAVVVAGAVAWSVMARHQPEQTAALTVPLPAPTPPIGAAPAQAAVERARPVPSAEAPAPTTAALPVPAAPPAEAAPAPMPRAPAVSRAESTKATTPAGRSAAPRVRAAQDETARPARAQAAPQERVYALHELPESVRRAMPPLDIGGSIYSATPASRFLIINGQIYHEGDAVAPELMLEEIRLKAAVLRFRDRRVQVTY
jgi:general secretion pathway protein B